MSEPGGIRIPIWTLLLGLALLEQLLCGATTGVAVVYRMERSRECTICHISWGEDFNLLEPVLAEPEHEILIDGLRARNSTVEMCWSCHDGYVVDSRDAFAGHNPHMKQLEPEQLHGELPLDENGKIYCGTCHTPHSHRMGRKYSYKPFLRKEVRASSLCLECHADHGGGSSNHPLHAELKNRVSSASVNPDSVECLSCHDLHQGDNTLRVGIGAPQSMLCIGCHESKESILLSDHDFATAQLFLQAGEPPVRKGTCKTCHTMHDAQGAGLWPYKDTNRSSPAGGDRRCEICHGSAAADGNLKINQWGHPMGEFPGDAEKPLTLPLGTSGVTCVSCHDPHQWSSDNLEPPGPGDEIGGPTSSFLRAPDQSREGLCVKCHLNKATVLSSPHGPVSENYRKTLEKKPWGCSSCHNTHGPDRFKNATEDHRAGEATAMCIQCHPEDSAEGVGLPALGEFSHPLGIEIVETSDQRKSNDSGRSQAVNSGTLGCRNCHDPHRWSISGLQWNVDSLLRHEGKFLRQDNSRAQLCLSCHESKGDLSGTSHDFSGAEEGSLNSCAYCHQPHNARSKNLLRDSLLPTNTDSLLRLSPWPISSAEQKTKNWFEENLQCLSCHQNESLGQRVPQAWAHPQDVSIPRPVEGENHNEYLRIACNSCHDPHVQSGFGESSHNRVNFMKSSSRDLLCADCHGEQAIWKYQFFHDRMRRRK